MGSTEYGYGEFRTFDEAVRYDLTGTPTGNGTDYKVVAKSGRYYAVERPNGEVAGVVAIGSIKNGRAWVKIVDESMGPFEDKAPASILDRLTPTDNDYANEWRAKCRANIAKKKAAPKINTGSVFTVETPVEFVNGVSVSRFRYEGGYRVEALPDKGYSFKARLPKTWRTDWKWKVVIV